MLTGPKGLFDTLSKSSITIEKRLMIDLETVRDSHANYEIFNLGFFRSKNNTADGLTKTKNTVPKYLIQNLNVILE